MKSYSNMMYTLMGVRVKNMPCSTLENMTKDFQSRSRRDHPLSPIPSQLQCDRQARTVGHFEVFSTTTFWINRRLHDTRKGTFCHKQESNNRSLFVFSPGRIYLPSPLQQFIYLVTEAAFARNLCFHIVAPNPRISARSWGPRETSYPAFLAEVSKVLQAYTRYKGNSQTLVDKATAFGFGMQMAHGSLDENGVRQVSDLTPDEKKNLLDSLWYDRINQLVVLFKKTERMRQNRLDTTYDRLPYSHTSNRCASRHSLPHIATTGHYDTRHPTKKFGRSERNVQLWHLLLKEPLAEVLKRHNIPLLIFLYNISPFWLPNLEQVEGNWDDQQTQLYQDAMRETRLSEILAYLMLVGLCAVYQSPTQLIKRMVLNKTNTCLFSFLVFERKLYNNIEDSLVWNCSTWVNV